MPTVQHLAGESGILVILHICTYINRDIQLKLKKRMKRPEGPSLLDVSTHSKIK